MAKLTDFATGSAFIYLFESDFKSKERFAQYANFMGQGGEKEIKVPIDKERAIRIIRALELYK